MPFWLEWWVWMSAALGFATLEVILPSKVFSALAIGSIVMGLLLLLGLSALGTSILAVIFLAVCGVALLILRRYGSQTKRSPAVWDDERTK